jgi:hypothetical protein
MYQKITLAQYLKMGGKLEHLSEVLDKYNNKKGKITFSHTNRPSFGNPNGVDMYNVGDKKVADSWIEVEVELVLNEKYL